MPSDFLVQKSVCDDCVNFLPFFVSQFFQCEASSIDILKVPLATDSVDPDTVPLKYSYTSITCSDESKNTKNIVINGN